MAIEHDFFGVVDDDSSGGLYWSETVEVGEQAVDVELSAPDAAAVSASGLDSAASVIRSLEGLDARARDALIAELSQRESVTTQYIDQRVDDMGESLLDLLVHNSGDIAMDVLRSLQLLRVALRPDRTDDDDPFAVFTYSIDPDETDAVLQVSFDDRGDVVAVDDGE
ncbi:DUF2004 domain-containing protein [Humibacter ginsenosidimutans]|uniref:DUF2004 domain-containing protein n=1 Tax=Humibacter ginsenosidimutans TaxID=2599293 RepID=A0A5B8M0B9_9MICO|nr:DUF2004 domain-containing protein [Humibacter ginsenosidimutans]QDZ14097.1 DUF2004 domain-containing protein [Humibacter ginsenosidimutans]